MAVGALYIFLSLVMIFSPSQAQNLKNRVEFLELQISRLSVNTKTEIMDLKEMIEDLNATRNGGYGPGTGGGVQTVNSEEVQAALLKMGESVSKQSERMALLERAFGDEKTRNREMIDALEGVNRNNEPNEKVKESIAKLNTRIDKEKFERNMSAGEMLGKMGDLTALVDKLSGRLDTLEGVIGANAGGVAWNGIVPKTPCPSGWTKWQNTCFRYVTDEKAMWDIANMQCHDLGGKLAEPETEAATRHVISLVGNGEAWIGATDDETEGTWKWFALRKTVDFLKWERGQPNNLGSGQNCLEIYKGNMNDETCTAKNKYVCQMDANVA